MFETQKVRRYDKTQDKNLSRGHFDDKDSFNLAKTCKVHIELYLFNWNTFWMI